MLLLSLPTGSLHVNLRSQSYSSFGVSNNWPQFVGVGAVESKGPICSARNRAARVSIELQKKNVDTQQFLYLNCEVDCMQTFFSG